MHSTQVYMYMERILTVHWTIQCIVLLFITVNCAIIFEEYYFKTFGNPDYLEKKICRLKIRNTFNFLTVPTCKIIIYIRVHPKGKLYFKVVVHILKRNYEYINWYIATLLYLVFGFTEPF